MALLGEPPVQPERQDFSAPLRYAPKAPPQRSVRTRRKEETRPCQLRINAVPNAAGSAYLERGSDVGLKVWNLKKWTKTAWSGRECVS